MLERTRCPITGSEQLETLIDLPFDSGVLGKWTSERRWLNRLAKLRFAILYNESIDFYFQRWVFDQEEERQRRKTLGELRPQLREPSLSELAHKAEDAMLIRLLHPSARPRVLDYGVGDGWWARMNSAYGAEVYGTDIDPCGEQHAAKLGVRFEPIDALPAEHFDFINADQVFEHLPDPRTVIRELTAALRTGGHLKISTPEDAGICKNIKRLREGRYTLAQFKTDFCALAPLSHINLFSAASLRALAASAGLRQFHVPLRICYSVMTGFHSTRQINRNLYNPWKRYRARGTWQFFVKK